jgi:hypothetical protein
MWIRDAFALVFTLFGRLVLDLEMGLGVFFDHGPILGAKAYGRLSELARFLSPGLFKEPSGGFVFIFIRIAFINIVEWGVYILVERQRVFNLGSLMHVSGVENNEKMKRTATVARARPPI